jgi:hypothetical protein
MKIVTKKATTIKTSIFKVSIEISPTGKTKKAFLSGSARQKR